MFLLHQHHQQTVDDTQHSIIDSWSFSLNKLDSPLQEYQAEEVRRSLGNEGWSWKTLQIGK